MGEALPMQMSVLSWRSLVGWLLLSVLSMPAMAEWVTVTGRAQIQAGQYDEARRAAQEDALRQLSLSTNARVSSESNLEQGVLSLDRVTVRSDVRVRSLQVLDEQVEGNWMKLTVAADVITEAAPSCALTTANGYRKQVAILGFALQEPEQALIGQLQNIDRALPAVLTQTLNQRRHVLALQASHLGLYQEVVNAPARQNDRYMTTYAVDAAKELGVQFVVSGVVRDLGVRSPEHFQSTFWNNSLRRLGLRDTERAFAVEVFVHDAFSGDVIFQKTYRTSGNWHQEPTDTIGFATDAFWRMEYGKAVGQLLSEMVAEVDEHLRCLPFMTRITRAQEKELQFNAGANHGVKPGDLLRVYQAQKFHDAQLFRGTQLRDVNLTLRVTHVQPGFAQGLIEVDASRANIQQGDVLIAW